MFYPLSNINKEELPKQFTYPFYYEAHPLCKQAALELQHQLKEWKWDNKNNGKMFGVLLVENSSGEIGYLWAYSGNIDSQLDGNAFVPPIFDLKAKESFFNAGEEVISKINKQIKILENSYEFKAAQVKVQKTSLALKEEVKEAKIRIKKAKIERQKIRKESQSTHSETDIQKLNEDLNRQSQRERSAFKRLKQELTENHRLAELKLEELQKNIDALKEERKTKSTQLQKLLFDQYKLYNARGEIKNLISIFDAFNGMTPPAASGDCAAPRLLQFAYQNQMRPIAMAEFWWGKSPISILRKEGHFYPSCRNKCEPILGHMLKGLNVETNPLSKAKDSHIQTVYEDDWLLIINKPEGILSVPGKFNAQNMLNTIEKNRLDIVTPFMVHRLDMATSGLLMLAKTEEVYKIMQSQFSNRKVNKRYIALLDGELKQVYGKIELPLRVDLDNRPQQMVCYEHGKPALTIYKVQSIENGKTRIAFYPKTGRTHQLRVHSAHINGLNSAIVGDDLYGTKANRLHLHAEMLEFIHPVLKKKMEVTCKVPF